LDHQVHLGIDQSRQIIGRLHFDRHATGFARTELDQLPSP
jgi:hypothetical protein